MGFRTASIIALISLVGLALAQNGGGEDSGNVINFHFAGMIPSRPAPPPPRPPVTCPPPTTCPAATFSSEFLSLPQNAASPRQRAEYLGLQQVLFEFDDYIPGRGGVYGTGPGWDLETEYELTHLLNNVGGVIAAVTQMGAALAANPPALNTYTDYEKLYQYFVPPTSTGLPIYTDEYFARERLTNFGNYLQKVKNTIPIPVTDADVNGLTDGHSLASLLQAGRLYFTDHTMLNSLPMKDFTGYPYQQYSPGSIAIYFVNDEGTLMPLAIGGFPDNDLVFTPNDNSRDWMVAKIAHNMASNFISAFEHFGESHSGFVGVLIATHRQLHIEHPLYGLLMHHLRFTAGVRALFDQIVVGDPNNARLIIGISDVGLVQIMDAAEKRLNFSTNIEDRLRNLGVLDLEDFPYGEDAVAVRRIILRFVGKIVRLHYPSDADVVADTELQAWTNEIATTGTLAAQSWPSSFQTRDQVIHVITEVIWYVVFQHSARNSFTLYNWNGILPTHPTSIYQPIPTAKGTIPSDEYLTYWLPPLPLAARQLAIEAPYSLRPLTALDRLGPSASAVALGSRAADIVKQFQLELEAYDEEVTKREAGQRVLPWTLLSPKNLPYYSFI